MEQKMNLLKKLKRYLLMFLMVMISFSSYPQEATADEILDKVLEVQKDIKDYSANIEIDVDVDFIKMPVKTATMYFKAPDKVKFKSDEFLMLPRKGLDQSVQSLLMGEYSAVIVGQEYLGQQYNYIIKVIPLGKKQDLVLATLWVDSTSYLITKMENYSHSRGNYKVFFEYYRDLKLPSHLTVEFEVEEFNIPLDFVNRTIEIDKEKMKSDTLKTGYVYIKFSDYQVNYGVEESVFMDE
jgi:outer membrane lipoprotein-sorting protein